MTSRIGGYAIKRKGLTNGFVADEDGTILAMIGLLLAMFCGLLVMTFDVGRIGVTHSEMQAFADHTALAAAGELDQKPDSITRATAAAAAMIDDYRTYGDANAGNNHTFTPADYSLTFFSDLPSSDLVAPTAVTGDPLKARFVRVMMNPIGAGHIFGVAFAAVSGQPLLDDTVSPQAIAGMTQWACDVTPMMFCIPTPGPGESFWQADNHIGQMIHLRAGGSGAAWGPGDFGFLDPDDILLNEEGPCGGLNGAQKTRCVLAAGQGITQCFAQNGVDTDPGQSAGIEDPAFNTRFDIWQGNFKNKKSNPIYAPAANVIKGAKPQGGGACINQNADPSNVEALPRDTCMISGSCGRHGDGIWADGNSDAYLATNHSSLVGGVMTTIDPRDNYGYPPTDPLAGTRFEMYHAEIKMAQALSDGSLASPTGSPIMDGLLEETVGPMCSPSTPFDHPGRRVLFVAAVNCDPANEGTEINGREYDVPVHEFVKMFLTEPVSMTTTTPKVLSIYAEVLGSAGGSGGGAGSPGGTFRDVVQLYR